MTQPHAAAPRAPGGPAAQGWMPRLGSRHRRLAGLAVCGMLIAVAPVQAEVKVASCSGIEILGASTYERPKLVLTERGGHIFKEVLNYQCARIRLRLPGYYGRLWTEHFAEELAQRLRARLDDGSRHTAEFVEPPEGARHLHIDETYQIRACFTTSQVPVTRVSCR